MNKNISILALTIFLIFGFFGCVFAQESTESADSVRDKVKEKIENVINKPKAYLGTITDKTEDTLQIKNLKGEIQFVSVEAEQTSMLSVGKTSKTIKYDDVALGDFIIAMGYIALDGNDEKTNGNSVLETKRILVTQPFEPTKRKIAFGNVVSIEKKILTLKSGEEEYKFEFPKSWKGPEIDEIADGDKVAIVGVPDEEKVIIRTIEIVSNNNNTPQE